MWNLLNYAAVTVPVGKADGELDRPRPGGEWMGYGPRNASDGFNHGQCEFSFSLFVWVSLWLIKWWLMVVIMVVDIDLVKDMPICLQIVGGRFGEEKAVAVAKVVDSLMNS